LRLRLEASAAVLAAVTAAAKFVTLPTSLRAKSLTPPAAPPENAEPSTSSMSRSPASGAVPPRLLAGPVRESSPPPGVTSATAALSAKTTAPTWPTVPAIPGSVTILVLRLFAAAISQSMIRPQLLLPASVLPETSST
jgi:hypothetical protein